MLWLCTCEARALLLQPFIGKGDVSIWAKNYRAGRLFVCLSGVLHSTREFFTLMIHHHYRLRASNFDQYSAHMTIEQWGFFNVPRLLCQRASVYNGHLREPVTIRNVALSSGTVTTCFYHVFTVCCGWDSNTQPPAFYANVLTDRAIAAVERVVKYQPINNFEMW